MDLFKIPAEYRPFMKALKQKLKRHNIKLVLSPSDKVKLDLTEESECQGFFDADSRVLAVAVAHPIEQWFPVLLHEDSHIDQYLHDPRWDTEWENYNQHDEWLEKTKIMNKKQIHRAVDSLISCELDADQRAVQKIVDWNLPIPIGPYIQQCNIIYFSYRASVDFKRWPKGLYKKKEAIAACQPKFRKAYASVPDKVMDIIAQHFIELDMKESV